MNKLSVLCIILLGGGSGIWGRGQARADDEVTVERATDSSCSSSRWTTVGTFDAGSPIAVTVDASWTALRVRSTSGASPAAIGKITLNGNRATSNFLDLIVAALNCPRSTPVLEIDPSDLAGLSWSGLAFASGSENLRDATRLTAAIGGSASTDGDLTGSVTVGSIWRLQLGGGVKAPIVVTSVDAAHSPERAAHYLAVRRIVNDGTSIFGSFTAAGDVGVIQVGSYPTLTGYVQGPIDVAGGISEISVAGDITIADSVGIRSRLGIDTISAEDVSANITSNYFQNNHTSGGIRLMDVSSFAGTLTSDDLGDPYLEPDTETSIHVSGACQGELKVLRDIVGVVNIEGSSSGDLSVSVAGSVKSNLFIRSRVKKLEVSGNLSGSDEFDNPCQISLTHPLGADEVHVAGLAGTASRKAFLSVDRLDRLTLDSTSDIVLTRVSAGSSLELHHLVSSSDLGLACNKSLCDSIQFDVLGSLGIGGTLSLCELAPGSLVRVGGTAYPETSSINIPEPGVQGQVIINANASGGSWLSEVVTRQAPLTPQQHIKPSNSQPDHAPYYERANLGGGAIGLVPFHLHREECAPAADSSVSDRTFANSEFCGIQWGSQLCSGSPAGTDYGSGARIELWFYGPIKAERTTGADARPYEIGVIDSNGDPDFSVDYGVWTRYEILPDFGGTFKRRLVISGGGEQVQLPKNHYVVRPKRDGTARLLCDNLLPGAQATPVGEFLYDFYLFKDCNTNGIEDGTGSDTSLCCDTPACNPDYTMDGNADADDIAYLIDVVAGGYNWAARDADFNQDGNVDQSDVDALVNTIGGGGCP